MIRTVLFGASVLVAGSRASIINEGRTSIVVDVGEVYVVSIDRIMNTADVITLPKDVYTTSPSGQNEYRAGAAYDIAELRKPGAGGVELKHVTEALLGIPIDGFIKSRVPLAVPGDIELARQRLTSTKFLTDLIKTNGYSDALATDISSLDMVKLWLKCRQIRFDKVTAHAYQEGQELARHALADGTQVLGVNTQVSDRTLADELKDPVIDAENIKIEIINGSGINGLGNQWGRMLTNAGAQIVSIDTAEEEVEQSSLVVSHEKKTSYTVKRLLKMKPFSIIESHNDQVELGDIRLILGKR